MSCNQTRMPQVFRLTTKCLYLHYCKQGHLFVFTSVLICASSGPKFDLDLADTFRKDKLLSPRARRVQIDTNPLLVKHICQMVDSPAVRDRCWCSKLFTGDLRRLNRAHPLRYKGKCPKVADNSEVCRNVFLVFAEMT